LAPTTAGKGRGKSNYFDLDAMASLYLIKLLSNYGFELSSISWLLKAFMKDRRSGKTIWEEYRDQKSKFVVEGYFMTIVPRKEGRRMAQVITSTSQELASIVIERLIAYEIPYVKGTKIPKGGVKHPATMGAVIINLLELIKEVERKTGVSL
jgi:hypothetical protein